MPHVQNNKKPELFLHPGLGVNLGLLIKYTCRPMMQKV